jgi:hypothetical protein
MTGACPLCATGTLDPGDVQERLLEDYWPEDGHPRYLTLKRELEADLEVDLTVTGLKQHLEEHLTYSPAADRGELA